MIRFTLRALAVVLLIGAVYLVVMQPKATVAQENLVTKVGLQVECSSVWSQWTHHAKPADLLLNGHPLLSVPEAQNACASASTTIKHVAEGGAGGAVVLFGLSLLRRRRH
jgi:hypothetical protein